MNFDNFHKALSEFQSHCSNLVQNLTTNLNRRPNPIPWARIAQNATRPMSTEVIEQRLEGVPVYALSNATDEFLLVSGASTGKNIGLFCFKKEDAEALLHQVTTIDPQMPQGSRVVPVALNKVFQLKVNGVAFRLIPEFSQVKNALHEREKSGFPSGDFFGVPVFQSRSLVLQSQNKKYRPLFFRKEDLENSLERASGQLNRIKHANGQGDIEVTALEDVIKEMKENSTSKWDDVIFIPPGFDVSANPNRQ
ncbi:protein TIC 22-like, chloroplastic [Cicer arietinum]|uniref:Protein TIC 22-like, chloroplastic n=1 Tax=Cicer arietinum TaxID=3827 RepID=A0A1S2YGA6_CICAR|nr:protein TIC 22-like, chloroplastic [Cicer arietinum]